MWRCTSGDKNPTSAGEDTQPISENIDSGGPVEGGGHISDDKEERTEEVNRDDELLVSGQFPVHGRPWDGLETAYNFHLQLEPSVSNNTPCPVCLHVTQYPARQSCGHILCFSCLQQSLSSLGDCPLCQAQQSLQSGKFEVVPASVTMAYSFAGAEQNLHIPITSSAKLSTPFQGAFVQLDHMHFTDNSCCNNVGTAVSTIYDISRLHYDLHNSSEMPLLDNLSDLDDVVDLDDLFSSDSERPPPPVTAKTSLSGGFIAGPARHPRTPLRIMSSSSVEQARGGSVSRTVAKVSRPPVSQVGKRKARTRNVKRGEHVIAPMEWEILRSVGTPPDPRYDCGLTILGNVMIVVGGIVGKLRLNDVHMLDISAKPLPRWVQQPICGTPPPRGHLLQVFVIQDNLYAIGGTVDGKFLTELHRLSFDFTKWKWEKLEVAGKPPTMRYWYSLTVLQGFAILYGGYGHSKRLSDTFALRFDKEIPTWIELQPRGDNPGPSSTHSACAIKNRMYIYGGYDGKYRRGQLFAFEIDDVSTESIDCVWRKIEAQGNGPTSRYTHSCACIDSQLIVYGGNTGCLKGDAYVLDLRAGSFYLEEGSPTWKLVKCDPPLIPRAWHRAVTYNGAMYVFGGNTTDGVDNNVMRVIFSTS
ncbi:hypothetical protein PsorP6_019082 [Peronosclerospora sorghi]|nr:hypothetical protein PsorP6_019082 [Peronosclerospora sorghi]